MSPQRASNGPWFPPKQDAGARPPSALVRPLLLIMRLLGVNRAINLTLSSPPVPWVKIRAHVGDRCLNSARVAVHTLEDVDQPV
jgi:hypothetical protein